MKKLFTICSLLFVLFANNASAASYPVGGYQYYLAGSGVTSSASTITLTSFKTPDGRPITMTMFGAIGYGALDPQTILKLENISFTGITQNSNGTAILTGVTRGVDFVMPYAASTTLTRSHSGGSTFILTNTASYYGTQFGMVNNPSTVTDYWTFPTPLSNNNPATKSYVDSLVTGGTTTNSSLIGPGTAGETVATGTLLYLNTSDARWYKMGTGVQNSVLQVILPGISQGSATAGVTIPNGVLLAGLDSNQTGLTAGTSYFATSTAGTLGTATTSYFIGKARTTTSLYVMPNFLLNYATTTFNSAVTFNSTTTFNGYVAGNIASTTVRVYSASGYTTWSRPTNIRYITIEVVGGGGGGGGDNDDAANSSGAGGGGGAYCRETIDRSVLAATTTVGLNVGTSGGGGAAAGGTGTTGGTSYFGTFCSAVGGTGGAETGSGGVGGTASGGDINVEGAGGGGSDTNGNGFGGSSYLGGGAGAPGPSSGLNGVNAGNYGGGGSGASNSAGGGTQNSGGSGASGVIIVYEFY